MAARRGRLLTAVVVVAVLGASMTVTTGVQRSAADPVTDRKKTVEQQIADLKESLEGASDDLVAAAVQLTALQGRLTDARSTLATAQASRAAAVERDAELADQLAFAEAELDKAQREQSTQEAAEADTRARLGQIAREAYVGGGMSGLSVALQATDPGDFSDRLVVAGVALRAQDGAIDRLSVVQADLRAREAELDAIRSRIADLKQQSAEVVRDRIAAENAAATAEKIVSALVTDEAKQVASIQGKVDAEKARLAELQAEQDRLQAILVERARQARERSRQQHGPTWTPPASGGFLSYAADGPVTSGFGMRYHPVLHIYRMHTGIDFGIDCGTPVHAAADGEVISAGWAGGYGNRVVIDHGEVSGGDLATTYNHLSRIVVAGGQVRRGQLIAYSGTTGLSTGCHLHFETLLDGRYVNPANYL